MAQTTLPAAPASVGPVPRGSPDHDWRSDAARRVPGPWSRALYAVLRPAARRRPRGECLTLLLTQIVDFPGRRPLRALAPLLLAHDRVLLPAIRAYRGRRITSRGAMVLAAFSSPTDAVLCGLAVQDLLALRNASAPEEEHLSIRLGVHLGELRFRRGRPIGAPLRTAAALCRSAAPGEVWLTRSVHLAMNHVEVSVEPLPAHSPGAEDVLAPLYRARRSPAEATRGAEATLALVAPSRLERALEPVSDAMASVEEGGADGRVFAALRVACAAAALAALGAAELLVRGALAGCGAVALLARCRGGVSPRVDALSRLTSAALPWIRSRRAIPRAALVRPLW